MANTDNTGGTGGGNKKPTWTWKQYEFRKPGELTAYQKHARSRNAYQQSQLQYWADRYDKERSYWEDPSRVVRYHKALKALPPGTEPAPWINKEEIDLAYEYMRQRNNGAPEWQWKYLPNDDIGLELLRNIQSPPDDALWPGERQQRWSDVGKGLQDQAPKEVQGYQPLDFEQLDNPATGMTDEEWDRLLPWQKALAWIGNLNPSLQAGGMGAAIGLVSGGPYGALAGAAMGAGMGAFSVSEEEREAHPYRAAFTDFLMKLDYPAEWFERALGGMAIASHRVGEGVRERGFYGGADAAAEIVSNLPALFKAAHLTYESDALNPYRMIFPWATMKSWDARSPIPTILTGEQVGLDALYEAFQRIAGGDRPEDVYREMNTQFGLGGQGREMLGHILLDPLNVLGIIGVAAGGYIPAIMTGNRALQLAAETSRGPVDMLRQYGAILRSSEDIGDIAKMGKLSRWLGGVTQAGESTDLVQRGGKGVFNYLFSLTPQARATEVVNNSATVTGAVLDRARTATGEFDPKLGAKYLHGLANTPMDVSKELSMRALGAPDAAAIPLALKDNVDKVDNIAAAWEASQPRLNVLNKLGELLGKDLEEVVLELADEGGAKRMLAQIQELAARSDAPEAKELLAAMQGPQPGMTGLEKLDSNTLVELAKPFQGKDGLPMRPEMVKAAMQQAIEDVTAEWAVNWFGVKPDPGWVRMANVVKSAQSMVLLGFNPTYFLNNTINNLITTASEGLLGFRTPEAIAQVWARAGIQPPRLRAGVGVDAGGLEQAHRIIKEATGTTGTLEDIRRGMDRTRRWQIFGRLSGWNERASSEQAVTSGFLQFMARNWRKDKGFSPMPPALEQRLAAIDPKLPKAIYASVEGGLSQAEIDQKIWQGLARRNVIDGVPEIARRTGIPEADVAEVLHIVGATSPEVAEQLAKAADDVEVNKILGDIERKAQNHLDNLNAKNLEIEAAKAAARVDGEGAQAALELFDQMSFDYSEHWFNHFVHMDTAAQQADMMEGPARSLVWENAFSDARRSWDRLNKRQESQMAGIARGLGLDSETGRRAVANLAEQHETWNEFYRFRDAQYRLFRDGSATWDEVSEAIYKAWEEAYTKQETIFDRMDAEYIQLFSDQFGAQAGDVAKAWRQGIKDIRAKMHADMGEYRAKGTDSWRQFLRGPYFEGIRALFEHNIEGAREMWRAATGKEPPPGPAAPTEPEFVDIDWKLGGSNLDAARAALPRTEGEAPAAVTNNMHQALLDLGYSNDQMRNMTPQQAWDAINMGENANVKRAAVRKTAQEIYPEVLATMTEEGQPRYIDKYILNVINKHGGQQYIDLAEVDIDVAIKAISEYKEQQLAKAAKAEEARKAQQALDLEAAVKQEEPIPSEISPQEPTTPEQAEPRKLGQLTEEQIAANEQELERSRIAWEEHEQEIKASRLTPAQEVRKLYDEGEITSAFERALWANKKDIKAIIEAVPELEARLTRARKIAFNLVDGNLDALPEDLQTEVFKVLEIMAQQLDAAEEGRRVQDPITGEWSGIPSTYPSWYNDVAGSYKGKPKNKYAVLEAIGDIGQKNLLEGNPPAVVRRIMSFVADKLRDTSDVYGKYMGYDFDMGPHYNRIWRKAQATYIPEHLTDLIDEVSELEQRIYDYYGGSNLTPPDLIEHISLAYDAVLKRITEVDDLENPPKPDPYIEEQVQAMEAARVAQASWEDDVTSALPAEDRRTNLELRQEIDRLQTEVQQLKIDPLTQIPVYMLNREAVDAAPAKIVLDVTGLKYLNDTYGEVAGDALLKMIANVAKEQGLDVHRVNMGGDEFVIPFGSLDEAQAAIEPLRQAVADRAITFQAGDQVTALAGFPIHAGAGDTFGHAYDAVNDAKRAYKSGLTPEQAARGAMPPSVHPAAPGPIIRTETPAQQGVPSPRMLATREFQKQYPREWEALESKSFSYPGRRSMTRSRFVETVYDDPNVQLLRNVGNRQYPHTWVDNSGVPQYGFGEGMEGHRFGATEAEAKYYDYLQANAVEKPSTEVMPERPVDTGTTPEGIEYEIEGFGTVRQPEAAPEAPQQPTELQVDTRIHQATTGLQWRADDVNYDVARRAYEGVSWVPEKRAARVQQDYVEHMQAVVDKFTPLADTPEKLEKLGIALERYQKGYLDKLNAYLGAKSRVVSSWIAGPANFPVAQMEKRQLSEQKRLNEFLEWSRKAQEAIRKELAPETSRVISGNDPEAIALLEKKIATLENVHQLMIEGNKIVRKKGLTDEEKIAELVKLGHSEKNAREALTPDYMGRLGFPDWALKNNNAEIRRLKGRVAELQRIREAPAGEWTIEGGRIVENEELNRIQILFDEKPPADVRARLKRNGFRWAPSEGAWQRQRTENAMMTIRDLFPDAQKVEAAAPEEILDDVIEVRVPDEVEPTEPPATQTLEQPAKFGKPQQMGMFGAGEDMPLFTGTAQRGQESVFRQRPEEKQLGFFDTRPKLAGSVEGGEATGPLFDAAVQVGQIRDQLRKDFISLFLAGQESVLAGVEDAGRQADAVLALLDAHANVWAKRYKRTPLEWYQENIAGVTREAPGGVYYQQGEVSPVWYSQLQRAVEAIPQEKLTVDQLRGMLAKGGVKAEEIKWTELDDFLEGKQKITKTELLDYLRQNEVQVEEVVKSATQYQGTTLPGGEPGTYRELLLKLPEDRSELNRLNAELDQVIAVINQKVSADAETAQRRAIADQINDDIRHNRYADLREIQARRDMAEEALYSRWNEVAGSELDRRDALDEQIKALREEPPGFRSPHWQEPNVLAHIRFDDRIDADGKRVLFIHEIQSDWHQAGRERGYRATTNEIEKARKEAAILEETYDRLAKEQGEFEAAGKYAESDAAYQKLVEIREAYDQAAAKLNELEFSPGIEPAPFAKTWDVLSMKRMLRWAAENGYDRIAFPTGPVAARIEGHQLIENVSHLRWKSDSNVIAFRQRGSERYVTEVIDQGKALEDYVGADAAKQLREMAAWEKKAQHSDVVTVTLDTNDIAFGGETMRWFYDRDLVNNVNKYLKKWGARVGETDIGEPDLYLKRFVEYNEEMGEWHVFERPTENGYPVYKGGFESKKGALDYLYELGGQYERISNPTPAHSIDITPEMKASVMQGQPLFQGPRGAVSFLSDGRAVLHALQSPDVSTLVHEVGHIFRRDLTGADLAIAEKWAGATDGFWTREAEEKFAKGFELYLKEGKAPVKELQSVFEQFAQWLAQVYARTKEYFTGNEINDNMRGVYNRLLAENPEAQEYNITTQTGRAKQGTLFQDGTPSIEYEDGRQTRLENNPPDAVKNPLGAVDSLHNEVPLHRMEEDGYAQHIQPVLDGLRSHLNNKDAALPEEVTDLKSVLDPDTARQLRGYLHQVYGQQSDMKLAGVRVAEARRDAALLNYSRRYGFDNVLMATHPYNFWYTRSMINWALRIADKPSWLANYYRLRSIGTGMQENENYPQRLKNKMRIPIPFMPEWAGGGVYVDPLRQMFPFMMMAQPFERLADQNNMIDRRAAFILEDWAEEQEADPQQVSQALQTRSGPLWEKAIAQAKVEIDEEIENPLDFVNTISGMSLPLNWAYQWMRGKPDRIGPLPTTRMVKGVTAMLGMNQGRGYNMEGPIRRALGMPEYDRYTDYRVDRMLANMAAEGAINPQVAQQAMIDRGQSQDPMVQDAFIEAERRVAQQGAMGLIGGPFQADIFPEGEQRQRAIKSEYSRAAEAWRAGDEDALSLFFDKYPEYEARLALYKDPAERLKGYLIGEVWDRYMELPDLHKRQAREQLGQLFEEAFLEKETRSYDSIKPETLALWAQRLGSNALLAIQEAPQGELELESPEITEAYQQLQDERDRRWPDIGSKLNLLYNLPPVLQDQYREMHPEIAEYEQWRTGYLADHPEIIPYSIGQDNKVAGAKPEIQSLYYQYLAMRDRQFPGVMEMQDAYYDNNKPKGFLKQNPMLPAYWEWRREFMRQYPEMIPYIMSTESLSKAVLGEDTASYAQSYNVNDWVTLTPAELQEYSPALVRQLIAYFYNNEALGSGARKELKRLWEKSGRGLKFEEYLQGPVRASVVNR